MLCARSPSLVQHRVPTPNDFSSLAGVDEQFLRFRTRHEAMAGPFQWEPTCGGRLALG
jgi:hypothetical protein